jgi:hypothetical protein
MSEQTVLMKSVWTDGGREDSIWIDNVNEDSVWTVLVKSV